jgi:hypothetical protein
MHNCHFRLLLLHLLGPFRSCLCKEWASLAICGVSRGIMHRTYTSQSREKNSTPRVLRVGYLILSENATRLIDEVRNQGLGPKLVGKQTITFLLCRLPSYWSGSEPEERDNAITFPCYSIGPRSSMRVKRHIWTINYRSVLFFFSGKWSSFFQLTGKRLAIQIWSRNKKRRVA